MSWTEEQTDRLKALNAQGKSSGKIAKLMGMTRNQVIGKLHRLGIASKNQPKLQNDCKLQNFE